MHITPKKINLESGQAMMTLVIFFMLAIVTAVFGVINPILKQAEVSKNLIISRESYFLANSSLEDVYYRLNNNKTVDTTETLSLNNATTTTVTTNTALGKQLISTANKNNNFRKLKLELINGIGASFNYGIQTGAGGIDLKNSSQVTGNVYSAGPITGSGNSINGDAVSSGATGLIKGITTTNSAYAHNLENSIIGANAYYVVKTGTTVAGTSFPNSPDQPNLPLPISDEMIEDMEAAAEAGGIISSPCPYVINSNQTMGFKKIMCDVELKGANLTLTGHLWIHGNFDIQNNSDILISPNLNNTSVAIIADNRNNLTTSSKISLSNNIAILGSGNASSFVFLISQNKSKELGGTEIAIDYNNSAAGKLVLYAAHGLIELTNSGTLREITGHTIIARNSATIIYDSGLINTIFTGGPGGGYEILEWREVE